MLTIACSKTAIKGDASVESRRKQKTESALDKSERVTEPFELDTVESEATAEELEFVIQDIYFAKGSYALQPNTKKILKRKAEWLRANPGIKIVIEGHTDEPGTREYNIALGERRAGAVKSL